MIFVPCAGGISHNERNRPASTNAPRARRFCSTLCWNTTGGWGERRPPLPFGRFELLHSGRYGIAAHRSNQRQPVLARAARASAGRSRRRTGPREQEALHLVAAGEPQQHPLVVVSTPSASTLMPSAWPSVTIDWMIAPAFADEPSEATKARSILSMSNGNICR